ncbi:hypothetical protein MXB_3453 [Myxobolus squamalis]|nr:hypothetical protein MXB_3453 [Myxobolus squamalis]
MLRLDDYLKHFIAKKISKDVLWRKIQIYYSGVNVPGEGEHKIMTFIRSLKLSASFLPESAHIIHGNDADLIMLGLGLDIINFSILREIENYDPLSKKVEMMVFHHSLLREYINQEFVSLKEILPFSYEPKKILYDWILMAFLVGNDFLPCLPFLHINNNALSLLWNTYKSVLPTLDGTVFTLIRPPDRKLSC